MQNLRIKTVNVIDNTKIEVKFTHNLTPQLSTSNVSIISDIDSSIVEVLQIKINSNILSIVCKPLIPYYLYNITFNSTNTYPFISLNGDASLIEDNITNKYIILGPLDSNNIFKQNLSSYLRDNIYNIDDPTTLVSKYVDSLSINLSKALYDIRQTKNENYLSFDIVDELKTRGSGPFDRLNEESAYELTRVARSPSGTNAELSFNYTEFPYYPITLQKQIYSEFVTLDSVDEVGKLNVNNLIATLTQNNITKVNSITFYLSNIVAIYNYNIETLGYQLKDSRYDKDYSSTYYSLNTNQVKLNDRILSEISFDDIIRVSISYEYKNLGIVVDASTVNAYTIKSSIREKLPSIINVFTLNHAPIVLSDNSIPSTGGITFTDPNSINGSSHPAFITEIPFRLQALPAYPGQYSIDYENGTVYVYGSVTNDGTGEFPPLATYLYRLVYQSEIDYVYDSSTLEFVALPNGSLIEYDGTINFRYEQVLIPDVDYTCSLHKEELSERADNRLVAINALKTLHYPITNAFRIFNETTGEIYNIDRWSDNYIYFSYQTAPNIQSQTLERVSFKNETNEMLFVNRELTNIYSIRIFEILLNNNYVVSSSEDSIASFLNTSLVLSDGNIFVNEKWFNRDSNESDNLNKLQNIGEYIVDYLNGVIYCAVSSTQSNDIGYVSYKKNDILPQHSHLISVDDIYNQISINGNKIKHFDYVSFGENSIIPSTLGYSDELYLNSSSSTPYIVNNTSVGSFVDSVFTAGVTDSIKYIRGLYEYEDLNNSISPLNFSEACTYSGSNITVSTISKEYYNVVLFDGYDYYVTINENIPYFSSNITYTFSVLRLSDSQELWDISGTLDNSTSNILKLVLSGTGTPALGDSVKITYSFSINNLSRIMVDYDKGDYYIDYTYLADELIVSYEYGDNVIDFSKGSNAIPENTEYYVSYKAGALREALYKNFGNLVNIPELVGFNLEFDRERYREALIAALSSFLQGPTVNAIKNIGKVISHINPEINENVFSGWSLGNSLLHPTEIETSGQFQLATSKFNNGALIDSNQTITLPVTSNLKLEEGTFETWITPQWNGLDNDADVTFTILKNNVAIDPLDVFIGVEEYHPELENGIFTINKNSRTTGTPNKNKDGVFIYYDADISGNFNRWYINVIDGYVNSVSSNYKITVRSPGTIYDSKSVTLPKPSNLNTFTGKNSITINITGGSPFNCGITFLSDYDHYLLDLGEETKNRISIFKDSGGYLNFRAIDKQKNQYIVSTDVSSWISQENHHIAVSWKLNTIDNRDEMHLFVDGFEVPNIIKYNQSFQPYLHQNFRTVNAEEVLALSGRDIISSTDLSTIIDGYEVTSSINFDQYNIFSGDTIYINEDGFDTNGYTIDIVNGQSLILTSPMPSTITNARFTINKSNCFVDSRIDIASNIAVATISPILDGYVSGSLGSNILTSSTTNFEDENIQPGYSININDLNLPIIYTILEVSGNTITISDDLPVDITDVLFNIYSTTEEEIPGIRAVRPSYEISKIGNRNVLTLLDNVYANDLILIRTLGLNSREIKKQYYVWTDNVESILMTKLPAPIALDEVNITKLILNDGYAAVVGPSNSTLIGGKFNSINFPCTTPSNSQNGRTINVTISGNNTDFSDPVEVTINGVSGYSTISETIYFTDYGTQAFSNKFISINYINVIVKPINSLRNALVIDAREAYPITYAEDSALVPVIKYSYEINNGTTLYNDGYDIVTDDNNEFSEKSVNSYLIIQSPPAAAGYYRILAVSSDRKSLQIQPTNAAPYPPYPIATFTNGTYKILKTTDYRTGLQNGYFILEASALPGTAYLLSHGFYEINYFSYTIIKFDLFKGNIYIGSDLNGNNQINSVVDQVKIYAKMLTDTRIGEQVISGEKSITRDYNSLTPLKKDSDTLVLIDFEEFPFTNSADFYINKYNDKQKLYSSSKVNDNFSDSLLIMHEPLIMPNYGILDSRKEGTIEFWTNPIYDTGNDPNTRYYFDGYSAMTMNAVSFDEVSIKVSEQMDSVLSVTLKSGDSNIDYFAGGKLEIDSIKAIQEIHTSISSVKVKVDRPILQIISVKIIGDYTGTDYFTNTGIIASDLKTIYLGRALPSSNTNVIVTYQAIENSNNKLNSQVIRLNKKLPHNKSEVVIKYIPKGYQGDRLSIYKDQFGYIKFEINASGVSHIVSGPTFWSKNSWHRIKASYKMNQGLNQDEMSLYLDGYCYYNNAQTINFQDNVNTLYVGSSFSKTNKLMGLINNLRISNIYRAVFAPYNEPIDISYNSNLNVIYPVTEDLYTTYLLDSSFQNIKNTDFTTIVNRNTGSFDFSVNIIDSFNIVNSSIKVKNVLEKLIKILKPANSKAYITYSG